MDDDTIDSNIFLLSHVNGSINSTDTNAAEVYWSAVQRLFLFLSLLLIIIVAIVGNTLVILVIFRHAGMRTRTNLFLCSLAVSDVLCALLDMPISLCTVLLGRWIFPEWLCQLNGFLMALFLVASIHTLMYIGIDKYLSIRDPLKGPMSRRRVYMLIAMAWLWAALTGYLTIDGLNSVTYKPYTTQCGPRYPSKWPQYLHPVFIGTTVYLLPFAVITFCYAGIFREMRAHSARLIEHSNQRLSVQWQQRRVNFTLFLVLVAFLINVSPYVFYSFIASALEDKSRLSKLANPMTYWLLFLNSAVNPIIYALRSPAFREGYKEILCRTRVSVTSEEIDPLLYARTSLLGNGRSLLRAACRSSAAEAVRGTETTDVDSRAPIDGNSKRRLSDVHDDVVHPKGNDACESDGANGKAGVESGKAGVE